MGDAQKNIIFQIAIVKILSKFWQHTFMSILNIQIDIRYKFLNIHKNFQISKFVKNVSKKSFKHFLEIK